MPRKTLPTWTLAALMASATLASAQGATVEDVVEPGVGREFGDRVTVDLTEGFWAKSGSDVVVKVGVVHQMADEPFPPRDPNDRSAEPFHLSGHSGAIGTGTIDIDIGTGINLPNEARFYAIEAIQIFEKTDDPCFVRLYGRIVDSGDLKGQTRRVLAEYRIGKCVGKNVGDGRMVALFPKESADPGGKLDPLGPWYLRSLQVCSGSGNILGAVSVGAGWKIKGVKIKPGDVQGGSTEVVKVNAVHNHHPRPNCPDIKAPSGGPGGLTHSGWSDWKACGEGQLVTGLTLHHWKKKWFTGIALKCQYVRLLPGPLVFDDDAVGY